MLAADEFENMKFKFGTSMQWQKQGGNKEIGDD